MKYWIFKTANQELYADVPYEKYVFDNTHSVKVTSGDVFIYLDKRNGYGFTATGIIYKLTSRAPKKIELKRSPAVRRVFTAYLSDIIRFSHALSISPTTKVGRNNRAVLGITNVNALGWSQSIPALNETLYESIMDLVENQGLSSNAVAQQQGFRVPDSWGETKRRKAITRFSDTVLMRSDFTCIVCGSRLKDVLEAAHLSPYTTDYNNRANPSNGVCLCTYCHRALDRRAIAINSHGQVLVDNSINDAVARNHFKRISSAKRKDWLVGVDPIFLELTVKLYNEAK